MALGQQYRGSRISRLDVTDDEDADDPFGKGFQDESSVGEEDGVKIIYAIKM